MRAENESRFPFITLAIAGAALLIHVVPCGASLLEFDRVALPAGEFWRLVTCHSTHWSFDHLAWDVLTFIGLGVACECRSRTRFAATFALSAIAIPLAVYAMLPSMVRYRGLSGIDSALFGLLAIDLLLENVARRRRAWVIASAVFIGGFFIKTIFEAATGSAVFADSAAGAFVPVPRRPTVSTTSRRSQPARPPLRWPSHE